MPLPVLDAPFIHDDSDRRPADGRDAVIFLSILHPVFILLLPHICELLIMFKARGNLSKILRVT